MRMCERVMPLPVGCRYRHWTRWILLSRWRPPVRCLGSMLDGGGVVVWLVRKEICLPETNLRKFTRMFPFS